MHETTGNAPADAVEGGNLASPDQTPWLSVLIPVYNVAPFLEECVESVVAQSDAGVEILLCDDASTDGSLKIAQALETRFSGRLRIVRHHKNRGLSAARNTMIAAASGDYLWFLDSDDYLLPGAIGAVRAAIVDHAPDIVGCNYRKQGRRKGAFKGPQDRLLRDGEVFRAGVYASRKMYAWLKVAKRELWAGDLCFPEGKYFEDAATTPSLMLAADSYFHIAQPLIYYRVRADSILSGITRTPGKFNTEKHLDLAQAFAGFPERLDQHEPPVGPETRFWASHFVAMEFCKIVSRIRRAGKMGTGHDSPPALAGLFRTEMAATSPICFEKLVSHYRRRGLVWRSIQLWLALRYTKAAS